MMSETISATKAVLSAVHFAAQKHRCQRRKDPESSPYINHPIAVADLLASGARISDVAILQAALLHDTLEDTATTPDELEKLFGAEVRRLVEEVTDDKTLPNKVRKQRQVEHAAQLSPKARLIKLADKICNLRELTETAPVNWTVERKREYLEWAERVISGIRGSHAELERLFDETAAAKRNLFKA